MRRLAGSIAIVAHSATVAQLRWFPIDPECRGLGLGKRLLEAAVEFCRASGNDSVILWTVSTLDAANAQAHLRRVTPRGRDDTRGSAPPATPTRAAAAASSVETIVLAR